MDAPVRTGQVDAKPAAVTWPPVRRLTLTLDEDLGRALRERALREERPARVEAARLLRSALVEAGELEP